MNPDRLFLEEAGLVLATVFLLVVIVTIPALSRPDTVFVGLECDGPSSVAVARRASDLPSCKAVERHVVG